MTSETAAMPSSVAQAPDGVLEDETSLVARAKRDRAAFAPLYARYFDPVYRYCYRRLGNADAAADATSQVFAKALASLSSCREASFRSWLFAIAHNVLVDRYRERPPEDSLEDAFEVADTAPSPEDLAIAADQRQRVVQLLARLPPDQRRILELRLAGLNSNEIAAALGRSRGSVDTAQCRALQRLRTLLGVTSAAEGQHVAE